MDDASYTKILPYSTHIQNNDNNCIQNTKLSDFLDINAMKVVGGKKEN